MNERLYGLLGEAALVVGLLCFVAGAAMLVLGGTLDYSVAALGAVALILVGGGAAMKGRGRSRTSP